MSDFQVAVLCIAIVGHGIVLLMQLFKSPKEMSSDATKEIHLVREEIAEIRDDHNGLGREVSELKGGMNSLREAIDGLRIQMTTLSNALGVYNSVNRSSTKR